MTEWQDLLGAYADFATRLQVWQEQLTAGATLIHAVQEAVRAGAAQHAQEQLAGWQACLGELVAPEQVPHVQSVLQLLRTCVAIAAPTAMGDLAPVLHLLAAGGDRRDGL